LPGGATARPGTGASAERQLAVRVRNGHPLGDRALVASVADPRFATGVGLVVHGRDRGREVNPFVDLDDEGVWNRVLERMREWLKDFF
ncbi:MAG: cell division protein FtsA, partial [Gemmatimonadota bacterium]|nr:cell division protein FtsA [Gemmatimonadota bacterium]